MNIPFIKPHLTENDIVAVFQFQSLHDGEYYKNKLIGRELAECNRYMDTLARLPLYYDIEMEDVEKICKCISF